MKIKAMLRIVAAIGIVWVHTTTAAAQNETVFDRRCVPCHRTLPMSLGEMFKKYLLVYSSERFVKQALANYLKHPDRDISLLPDLFFDRYDVKAPTTLSDDALEKALDIYWQRYKVIGKLR